MTPSDYPRLTYSRPQTIHRPRKAEDVQKLFKQQPQAKFIVSGRRKSHGGHLQATTGYDVIDTINLQAIHSLASGIVEVDAGCTWQQIQEYLNPHGLSPLCQQSSYDFSVGGSIAGNIHGRDIAASTIEHGVEWLEVVLTDGRKKRLSRTLSPELFWLQFGSQGQLAVIVRAGLRTTSNSLLRQTSTIVSAQKLTDWFIAQRDSINFFIARPNIRSAQLDELLVTTWSTIDDTTVEPLSSEKNVLRDRFIFWASTKHPLLMRLRWQLEKLVNRDDRQLTRNNALRPPTTPLAMFATKSARYSYVAQELFIPQAKLSQALSGIWRLSEQTDYLVLSGVTIRHIGQQRSPLGYARHGERWAVMQYWQIPRSQAGLAEFVWLQHQLATQALDYGGTVYLSYTSNLDRHTLLQLHPQLRQLVAAKKQHDPNDRLISDFMERLAKTV